MIQPSIVTLKETILIGMRMNMSFAENRTPELWQGFMPHRKEIIKPVNTDLYSLQNYPRDFFVNFAPARQFEKWAAVAVDVVEEVPENMETFVIPAGLYALFQYRGLSNDATIFQWILNQWLPSSGYVLDHRPHFELLGNKYKNNDPSSEELIYIPIRKD